MRPLELKEKRQLYRFTKVLMVALGIALIAYGGWFFAINFIGDAHNLEYWFGIFPAYLGSMLILVSLAMKVEWFTDARRFW
jgi:hypothetical protein